MLRYRKVEFLRNRNKRLSEESIHIDGLAGLRESVDDALRLRVLHNAGDDGLRREAVSERRDQF